MARRVEAGPELEARLEREIEVLDVRHGGGFVVRLHVLGDFYSVEYVGLWRRLLRQYPTLRVFGYTARIDAKNYLIAAALASAADEFGWDEVFGAVGVRADDQSRPAIESGMVFNFVIEPRFRARQRVSVQLQAGRGQGAGLPRFRDRAPKCRRN